MRLLPNWPWLQRLVEGQPVPSEGELGSPVEEVVVLPLNMQFQRIGGNITPATVTKILRDADAGYPARLVDLTNESRQKDGHLHGTLSTRDMAVALLPLEFVPPDDATPQEEEAVLLCRRIRDGFKDWPVLIEDLTAAYLAGHATTQLFWEMRKADLIPVRYEKIHDRDFIFRTSDGRMMYAPNSTLLGGSGIDLAADNPGRIIQIKRRIVGDVEAREGLARIIVWSALLRNWNLKDWIALAEVGWKPWRVATYKKGTIQKDIDKLIRSLERIGSHGVAALMEGTDLNVHWPKGTQAASSRSVHAELFMTLGREQSKAVLGQTTSTEPGENGDRASTETRDQIRKDIREGDARSVAAALWEQLFCIAVAVNLGPDVRTPVPVFVTDDPEDRVNFSEAIKNLVDAGVRIPVKWVREEIGMPEPTDDEDEEIVGGAPINDELPPPPPPGATEEEKAAWFRRAMEVLTKAVGPEDGEETNAEEYIERLSNSNRRQAVNEISTTVALMIEAVEGASSYGEARQAILDSYRGAEPPRELAALTEGALILAQAAGMLGANEEMPEIPQPDES